MASIRQGTAVFSALLFLAGTGLVVQLWLLSSAVNALLAHQYAVLKPVLGASILVALINAALVSFVFHFDKKLKDKS
jgi:hypothetical protein